MVKNFIGEPYYSEMRTRQQLGYIVASFMTEQEAKLYARFLIQSADYPADELMRRSEELLASLVDRFDLLPDEKLEEIRAVVQAELEEKDKSIAERAARYFTLAFEQQANWGETADTIAALQKLTRDDLRAVLRRSTSKNALQFTTLSMAEQHAEALGSVKPSFSDITVWKRQQTYQ